jgi:hypothetical protein
MTLAQQREKERMTNVQSARSWRCYFLSTSNLPLDAIALHGKVVLNDAVRSRLTEIPLPADGQGIYEELYEFRSGEELSDVLSGRCRKYYGVAGREFERRLVDARKKDVQRLRELLAGWRIEYIRALKRQARVEHLKPMQRSTGRCATVFAAGRLAINYGLVPWTKKELLDAVLCCQLDGLRYAQTVAGLRRKLVQYLADNREKFWNLAEKMPRLDGKHKFGSVPGYSARFKGKRWLYVTSDKLKAVIGTGQKAAQLKADLVKNSLLARGSTRKDLVQRKIFPLKGNKGHRWVHAFRAKILSKND